MSDIPFYAKASNCVYETSLHHQSKELMYNGSHRYFSWLVWKKYCILSPKPYMR